MPAMPVAAAPAAAPAAPAAGACRSAGTLWLVPDTRAAQADDASAALTQWVHLLPAGTVTGRDGRGPYTVDAEAVQAVLAAYAAHGGHLPVDYEHQSLGASQRSGPVPAAGWIEALEARADGVWGLVRWTERAAELLSRREYRYLSPVFSYLVESGRVIALEGAALTHTPNLAELQAAASRQPTPTATPTRTTTMPPAADQTQPAADAAGTAAASEDAKRLSTREELLAHIAQLNARLATAEATAQAAQATLAAKPPAQPDPAQWVPRAEHQAVVAAHAELQRKAAAAEAEAAVTAAQAAGRLTPAMLDWARAYAAKDPAGFAAWAKAAPAVAPAGTTAQGGGASGDALDPVAVASAAQAWQTERERAGVRVSIADAVAHVLSRRA
jgi:phage I-like protein